MDLCIDHVHAVTTDLDKSIEFYRLLGFRLLRRIEFGPDDARRQIAYVGKEGSVVELVMPRGPGDPLGGGTGARPFAFTVDDAEMAVQELQAMGVEVIQRPSPGFSFTGKTAAIRDPSGIVIELREWGDGDSQAYPVWQAQRADVVNIT